MEVEELRSIRELRFLGIFLFYMSAPSQRAKIFTVLAGANPYST